MPPTRVLALTLGVSRSVVVSAYEQLTAEGYLTTRPGTATSVARLPAGRRRPAPRSAALVPVAPPVRHDLAPGRPDLAHLPRIEWGRAVQHVLRTSPDRLFGYGDASGAPELRRQVAAYLRRVRGVDADADNVVITAGVAQALVIVARLLGGDRPARIGVEDPGSTSTTALLEAWGAAVDPVAVDDAGICVDRLDDHDAVLVTPAHQFPTGVVLSSQRRNDLVSWAVDQDARIVEDDYDAELRYDHEPVAAVHGLAPDRVIYLNSVSKTLWPALRIGWAVLPDDLVEPARAIRHHLDLGPSEPNQSALAHLIATGVFERHIQHQRRAYRARRRTLVDALDRHLPHLHVTGIAAGLHLTVETPTVDDRRLVADLANVGINAVALSTHTRNVERRGLIIGYGLVPTHNIDAAIAELAEHVP